MEHYNTAGDDISMLFGLCVDEAEYHPVETVELGGLEVGTKHNVVVGAEAAITAPSSRQFELWTGTSGPPGAMDIKQTSSTGGSITLFWNNPPSDRGGLGDAGDFEFSIFASSGEQPLRGVPPSGIAEGATVSLDAAVTSSFGRAFTSTWNGVIGWPMKTDQLVMLFQPSKYAIDSNNFNSVQGASFTLSKGTDMRSISVGGVLACDGSGGSSSDRDTGFRGGKLNTGVISAGSASWTVGGWIYKNAVNPANEWHIFSDGGGDNDQHPGDSNTLTSTVSGDVLTINTDGEFWTSMGDRFKDSEPDFKFDQSWNDLTYGWHELTLRYDQSTNNLKLFVDGVPETGGGHTVKIQTEYSIRNFWGWGAKSTKYKYDGIFGRTYAYTAALNDADVLYNHQGIAPTYGSKTGPFGTLERCQIPFRPNDGTSTILGDGSRRDVPGLDCTWLHAIAKVSLCT